MTLLFAVGCTFTAFAQQYQFLTLRTTQGSEQSFPSTGLKITFSGGQAHFTSQGATTSLSLEDLSSMQFTPTATSISSLGGDDNVNVFIENGTLHVNGITKATPTVVSLDGRNVGTDNLSRGLYLVRIGSKTYKVWSK